MTAMKMPPLHLVYVLNLIIPNVQAFFEPQNKDLVFLKVADHH